MSRRAAPIRADVAALLDAGMAGRDVFAAITAGPPACEARAVRSALSNERMKRGRGAAGEPLVIPRNVALGLAREAMRRGMTLPALVARLMEEAGHPDLIDIVIGEAP